MNQSPPPNLAPAARLFVAAAQDMRNAAVSMQQAAQNMKRQISDSPGRLAQAARYFATAAQNMEQAAKNLAGPPTV